MFQSRDILCSEKCNFAYIPQNHSGIKKLKNSLKMLEQLIVTKYHHLEVHKMFLTEILILHFRKSFKGDNI